MASKYADSASDDSTSRLDGGSSFAADGNKLLLAGASLTILGENLTVTEIAPGKAKATKAEARGCCAAVGLGGAQGDTKLISIYNVLWAEVAPADTILITFADPTTKSKCVSRTLTYALTNETEITAARQWIRTLLDQAYGDAKRRKTLKVLINPFGGSGGALKMFAKHIEPLLRGARCVIDVEETTHKAHAVTIAEQLDVERYDAVFCISGDGVPHEIFNGLGKRPDAIEALRKVAVCQLPGGSGNGMCWNLTGTDSPSLAALAYIKGVPVPLDLVSVTQNGTRSLSFLSQSVGIVAEVDLATETMRWMGGVRFTVGFIQRILGEAIYPADIAIKLHTDDKAVIREHYRRETSSHGAHTRDTTGSGALPELKYGTDQDPLPADWELVPFPKLGNFYAGNMAWMSAGTDFFPAALPNDGFFDLVTINGDIGRMKAVDMLLKVETGGHYDFPDVKYRKVLGYRIIPKEQKDGYISIDGERIPFGPYQAEVHSGLGTVLAKRWNAYEAPGV